MTTDGNNPKTFLPKEFFKYFLSFVLGMYRANGVGKPAICDNNMNSAKIRISSQK